MKKDKLKMNPKKFSAIFISVTAVLLVLAIVASLVMNYWYVVMNEVFGSGDVVVRGTEDSATWDTDYYNKASSGKEQIEEQARELAERVEAEGAVLLKNEGVLPLESTQLAVFGWSFSHPVYGGTGSGAMTLGTEVTPREGLENAGFTINEGLQAKYDTWSSDNGWNSRPVTGMGKQDWQLPEMLITTEAVTAKGEGANTAIFWISRQGGEAVDLPTNMGSTAGLTEGQYGYNPEKHYLELSDEEEAALAKIEESYDNIVVIINSSNAMELGEMKYDEKIGAILWVGSPGQRGFAAVGKILSGEVNPSGRLADTYYADFTADPTFVNFSDPAIYSGTAGVQNVYNNVTPDTALSYSYFVDYEEGIYMGYRYYETRYGADEEEYWKQVDYPFGYGLSYTTFEQELSEVTYDAGTHTITVTGKVTNTGKVDGREVVQIYYGAPYYVDGSRIEKSAKVLIGYTKLDIPAGQTKDFTITFTDEDMASYDDECYYSENGSYVLESGAYTIYLGKNSHDSWDSKTITVSDTLVYADAATRSDAKAVGKRESDSVTVENAFRDTLAGSNLSTVLSRSDWEGTFPTAATDADRIASQELLDRLQPYTTVATGGTVSSTGVDNGLTLTMMRGLDYDDERWEAFLDQFTIEEMRNLIYEGGFQIGKIERLGIPDSAVNDGPSALKSSGLGTEETSQTLTCMPSAVVTASTWNKELAQEIGQTVGMEGLQYNMSGWYAPGLNTHRSPFGGRNFEYFSEDPYLAGTICADEVSGAAEYGLVAYVKHFAMNDQESYRNNQSCGAYTSGGKDVTLLTWADEQTIREIYLKPFEIVVKNAKVTIDYISDAEGNHARKEMSATMGIMSSFNYIGNTWAGGSEALLTTVLRNEWGFRGTVITDAAFFKYMNTSQMIRAGGDLYLYTGKAKAFDLEGDASTVTAMRNATHNICYTVVNSNAVNGLSPADTISYTLAPWQIGCIIAIAATTLVFAATIIICILRRKDAQKYPERYKQSKR